MSGPRSMSRTGAHTLAHAWRTAVHAAAAAICLAATPAAAQTGFQTLDYPGALQTSAYGINNQGAVVGEYIDGNVGQHGFLYSGGQFTSIEVPGADTTVAFDINDSGQIVGRYTTFDGWITYVHGFVLSGGSFTTFDVGTQDTWPFGINNDGEIVGWFNNVFDGAAQGFKRSASGSIEVINVLGSEYTELWDINDDGLILGNSDSGIFQWLDGDFYPPFEDCPTYSYFGKINNLGRIVGTSSEPFICSASGVRSFLAPVQSAWTLGYGLNDNGMIVGAYWAPDYSVLHGFIAPVQPLALRLTMNAFLPFDNMPDPHPVIGNDRVLEGDGGDRSWDENGSSRVSQIMDVRNQWLSPGDVFLSAPNDYAQITQQYQASTSLDIDGKLTYEARNDWETGTPLKTSWGTPVNQAEGCSGHIITNNPNPNTVSVAVNCYQSTPNGVYPSWLDPAIAWEYSVIFVFGESPTVSYSLSGCRKYFPSYEIWAAGQQILAGWRSADPFDIMIPCGLAVQIETSGTVVMQ